MSPTHAHVDRDVHHMSGFIYRVWQKSNLLRFFAVRLEFFNAKFYRHIQSSCIHIKVLSAYNLFSAF